ncbi:hypothetical protein HDV04_000767 [Boothiomyces sp. JEL0838]|nr:hypothetical protein HDV04_000767 [Boothiomyces sp. JEL0838]
MLHLLVGLALSKAISLKFNTRQTKVKIPTDTGETTAFQSQFVLEGFVQLGTPPQNFSCLFDTGSDLFWVRDSTCNAAECQGKNKFDSSKSSTFVASPGIKKQYAYQDGTTLHCTIYQDVLTIGNASFVENVCLANYIFTNTGSVDSLIGLAAPNDPNPSDSDVLHTMLHKINPGGDLVASFWYNQDQTLADGSYGGGQVNLGGIDLTKNKSEIQFIGITQNRDAWYMDLNNVLLGNTTLWSTKLSPIIDSGTSLIMIPTAMLKAILAQIPHKYQDGIAMVDCTQLHLLQNLTFNFNGIKPITLTWQQQITMDPEDELCILNFQGVDKINQDTPLIFGAAFLRTVYSVFDYTNGMVGFADPVGEVKIDVVPYKWNSTFSLPTAAPTPSSAIGNLRRFSSTPRNFGLEEFFDSNKGWVWEEQALKTGRAWMSSELRNKSFEDLHSLWWVCIKEMNKLLSQQQEARRFKVFFTQDTRKHQVKLTMARIKQVLWERRKNWMEANEIYKQVKNNEIVEAPVEHGRRKRNTSWTIV